MGEDTDQENGGGGGGGGGGSEWKETSLFAGFVSQGFVSQGFAPDVKKEQLDEKFGGGNDFQLLPPPPSGVGGGRNSGSIAERRAARCGFNAARIHTARFRSITSPLSSPTVGSPYLTIPAGLSPTSLLDSPVMLPNSQALPSPTTGTFTLPPLSSESTMPFSATTNSEKDKGADVDSSFIFKPHVDPISLHCAPGTENQVTLPSSHALSMEMVDVNHRTLAPVQAQVGFECQAELLKQPMTNKLANGSSSDMEVSNNLLVNSKEIALQSSNSGVGGQQAPLPQEQVRVEVTGSQQILEVDQRVAYPPAWAGRPSEDGYNWRKYGQKQVKGSEYPRSYYKCTHPNCQVKKKIERSHDGQITEIIYKGGHNHPKPQPSRRSTLGSAYPPSEMAEIGGEDAGSYVKVEGGSAWRSAPQGSNNNKGCSDWRTDGMERTSSTSVLTELSDPLSTAQGKQLSILESADTPELSSTLASHDEEDDRVTQGSISLGGDDGDEDEQESKRRKKDSCLIETSLASRAVREPRVVVQTDSEVDILDDGYRWRKYGQKVVKGNPNPRSYYKCTNAGCTVRKHVERASHDLKYVITTYEGKHNHEVPAARSSGHANSSGGNASQATSNSLSRGGANNIPKPEQHVQDLVPCFERKPDEFFRSANLGGFANDGKFVPSACYDLKLPPYQAAIPCASYGLTASHNEVARQAAAAAAVAATPISQVVPDFPLSVQMNVPLSGNMAALNGFAVGPPSQSYLRAPQHQQQQQLSKDADMRFYRLKQEQKDDAVYDMNHLAAANGSSSSVYRQMMGGGYPL